MARRGQRQSGGKPTIKDLARAAGVSTATVSLSLRNKDGVNSETRAHVLKVAAAMDYQLDERASRLRRNRSNLLGVVLDLRQEFHVLLADGIYAAVVGTGFDLTLSGITDSRSEEQAIRAVMADRCEGFLLVGSRQLPDAFEPLSARGPVVTIGRELAEDVDSVSTSSSVGARLAVDHLVGLGHSRIGIIDGGQDPSAAVRRKAVRGALAAHNLRPATLVTGGSEPHDGERAAAQVLRGKNHPTALVCHNDHVAIGALLALRAAGIGIPGDISIVGYDDNRMASLTGIALTTVRQDPGELARLAVTRLLGRIEGDEPADRRIELDPTLQVRDTTGPPPDPVRPASAPH